MKKQWIAALLTMGLVVSGSAQAAVKDWLPKPAADTTGLKKVYAGVGITNELYHLNTEIPTGYGNMYVKLGAFIDGPSEPAGQIGFRYPYFLTGTDKNGYYFGGFLGHVETRTIDSKKENRLGAGGELSYVWMNSSRVSVASVGIGVGEGKKDRSGNKEDSKPMIMFGYSFNFGIY